VNPVTVSDSVTVSVSVSDSVTVSVSVSAAVPEPGFRRQVSGVRFHPFFMPLGVDIGPGGIQG